MSDPEPRWQTDMFAVVVHGTELKLLAVRVDGAWTLPRAQIDKDTWSGDAPAMKAALRETTSIDAVVLRLAHRQADEANHRVVLLMVMALAPGAAAPADAAWVGADALDTLTFAHTEHRAAVQTILEDLRSGHMPAHRVPWATRGWLEQATAWMAHELEQRGLYIVGSVEQRRVWTLSCVLRAATNAGDVYFKVTRPSPLFVNEAALVNDLSQLLPRNIPNPIAIHRQNGWLLLRDFGKEIGWNGAADVREAALRGFVQLQQATVAHVDTLLSLGCIDRRLNKLVEQSMALWADDGALVNMSTDEVAALHRVQPKLQRVCERLAAYRVPATLMHGDLHMGNIAHADREFVYFDWSDACIAHPFLDMIDVVHQKDEALRIRLRDAFLSEWTAYEPMSRLLEMWRLAEPLCALHQAISYRSIQANTEAALQAEFDADVPYWLRKVLAAMETLPEI